MNQIPISTYVVLAVVSFTAIGLYAQCLASYRTKRAEFLSFPIALFVLLPYPAWAAVAFLRDDSILLLIMALVGVPNLILSIQYFTYEWPRIKPPKLAPEDKLAIALSLLGGFIVVFYLIAGEPLRAAELGGVFFTSCLMLYSYLVKIWRVSRGQQNINGLKWAVLITLAVQYAVMIMYGRSSGIWLLQVGYVVAEASCIAAIIYKLTANTTETKEHSDHA